MQGSGSESITYEANTWNNSRNNNKNGAVSIRVRPIWYQMLGYVLPLLAVTALSGICTQASAATNAAAALPSIVILPFGFFDFALDERPGVVDSLQRWTADLSDQIGQGLSKSGKFRVIGNAAIGPGLRKLAGEYSHPTNCRSCMIALGKTAGAKYVLIGSVHKLSNLLTWVRVDVDDVRTGKLVDYLDLKIDGGDNAIMYRRIARSMTHSVEQNAALTH